MYFVLGFTNWIGGMGVLVMILAVLPAAGASTVQMMKAESPGPDPGKLVPKIGQTAKILYSMYIALTTIQVILLLIGGMPLYDTLVHSFSTAGTGGFSSMNLSVGAYNNAYYEVVIAVLCLFTELIFPVLSDLKGKEHIQNEEFRFYLFALAGAVL